MSRSAFTGRQAAGAQDREYLLLPVKTWFIGLSLLAAFALNMLPVGRVPWLPDVLGVVLAFWGVRQPRKVGMLVAFAFGLAMDVHSGALLGQHALSYTLLSFFAITIHRRLLWFSVPAQALHVLPLFVMAHVVVLLIRLVAGGVWPGWSYFAAPALQALLWPVVTLVLLAPQRGAVDPDENRPI
jgi:rod shape-determining protein MreD